VGRDLLIAIVLVLFGWAAAMALVALALRWTQQISARRRAHREAHWQPLVEDFVLEERPLPSARHRDLQAVLDLLLRYADVLRGPEADRITAFLEEDGYVALALHDLGSRGQWKRARAAERLGRMRSTRAVPFLIDAMQDDSADVRVVAARALATIGDPRAIPSLAAALGDPSRWTASNVASELIALGLDAVPTLQQIAWSGEPGKGGSHEAAVTAVRVLGDIRDPRAAPVLLHLLSCSSDLNMRARSAAALGSLGGSQVAAALRAALEDPAWQVRAQAASGLGRLCDVASVAALAQTAEDRNWWVRRNCAESLAKLGEAGESALTALTASPDPYVRDRANAVLEGLALRESRPGADDCRRVP
jgi:HEAT repeat protein